MDKRETDLWTRQTYGWREEGEEGEEVDVILLMLLRTEN